MKQFRKEVHVSADVEKPNPDKRKHDENDTRRKKLKTDINEGLS